MKKYIFICLLIFSTGCAVVYQSEDSTLIQPKLLKQTALPPLTESTFNNKYEFACEMLIDPVGDVRFVKLLTGSGDPSWDSLAQLSLLEWKYSPAIYNGNPIKLLVRRNIKVIFVEPKIFSLAEILFADYLKADSVYNMLMDGDDFFSLASKYSISSTRTQNGLLGNVNIKYFAENISYALAQLGEGDYTKPLNYGKNYIIIKRLKEND